MESARVSAKPLSKEECKILLSYIEKSKVITCKTTNATSNKIKIEEWNRIADGFNSVVPSCLRTPQQLRLKWENLKKIARRRKRNTMIRMNIIKTGGGEPDYIPPDEVSDRVAALLGNTVNGLSVEYGGDAEQDIILSKNNIVDVNEFGSGSDETGSNKVETPLCLPENKQPVIEQTFTPKATGHKRKFMIKTDENRAARNEALANYYKMKTKLLEANQENVLLENKKLKLEIEKLQKT